MHFLSAASGAARKRTAQGLLNSAKKSNRKLVYNLALDVLNDSRSRLDAATKYAVLQKGLKDDLTVGVQLRFWQRFGSWRLKGVEEEELCKQDIFCKVCSLEFKIGSNVACIPAIQSGIVLDLGHLGYTRKEHETGKNPIRLSKQAFTDLKTASSYAIKTSSQQLVKMRASDEQKRERAAAQEGDPGVYFVYPGAWVYHDTERLYSLCKVVGFSFMHWNCFQARILACRQSEEIDQEILPAHWSTAIS